jgi:hypothetical protein
MSVDHCFEAKFDDVQRMFDMLFSSSMSNGEQVNLTMTLLDDCSRWFVSVETNQTCANRCLSTRYHHSNSFDQMFKSCRDRPTKSVHGQANN